MKCPGRIDLQRVRFGRQGRRNRDVFMWSSWSILWWKMEKSLNFAASAPEMDDEASLKHRHTEEIVGYLVTRTPINGFGRDIHDTHGYSEMVKYQCNIFVPRFKDRR
jgi:hypothetical protein